MKIHFPLKVALLVTLLAAQTAIAGSSLKAVAISPGERCVRCERVISDRFLAAEAIWVQRGGVVGKFRTVRCMLTYLKEAAAPPGQIYVADGQTGKLVAVEKAVFVPVSIDTFTGDPGYGIGETDYVAFRSARAAEQFAAARGVSTMSWPAVEYYAASLPVRSGVHLPTRSEVR